MNELIEKACATNGWTLDGGSISVGLDGGRHQVVRVDEFETKGLKFLRFYSQLGLASEVDEMRLRASLRLNWTLPYGAVAIADLGEDGERLLLCDSLPLENADVARVTSAVDYLARTADSYEKFVFGTDDH